MKIPDSHSALKLHSRPCHRVRSLRTILADCQGTPGSHPLKSGRAGLLRAIESLTKKAKNLVFPLLPKTFLTHRYSRPRSSALESVVKLGGVIKTVIKRILELRGFAKANTSVVALNFKCTPPTTFTCASYLRWTPHRSFHEKKHRRTRSQSDATNRLNPRVPVAQPPELSRSGAESPANRFPGIPDPEWIEFPPRLGTDTWRRSRQ